MPRVCKLTGARTTKGNRVRYRGKAKYLGGIGKKVTSISRRSFKPNLQKVTTLVDGKKTVISATARALKKGTVVKAPKRKYAYTAKQKND